MISGKRFTSLGSLAAAVLAYSLSGCGGGGGGSNFAVDSFNVAENSVWRINRPIEIRFTQPVDINTVSLNTISIRQTSGTPSAGEFSYGKLANNQIDKALIVFQPLCPKKSDYSDAGLLPGGVQYEISLPGADSTSGATVRSEGGDRLSLSQSVTFVTPSSTSASQIFFDPVFGGPRPKVRAVGDPADAANPNFTYIEVGKNPNQRVYFERDSLGQVSLEPSPLLPNGTLTLNPLSDVAEQLALVIHFDQPIDPSSSNISNLRLRWEYQDSAPLNTYATLSTTVTLTANCVENGASVRVDAKGDLPPAALLRGLVASTFQDLIGEANIVDQINFAIATTQAAPPVLADEYLEEFTTTAFDDQTAALADPHATWGSGALSPSFSFPGTGGPSGNFDLLIPANQTVIFDTVSSQFIGGPNFAPTTFVTALGGILNVRNLRIDTGATFLVQGPNPVLILASGKVEIFGRLLVRGANNIGVASLNTPGIPEDGSLGVAGGGKGGTGSPLTNASDPKGGNGFGAFNSPDGGGEGGETTWNEQLPGVDNRRGAGGGGGVLGANQLALVGGTSSGPFDQAFIGLDAEQGFGNDNCGNSPPPKGAISGTCPSIGGFPGVTPFIDSDSLNNFYGSRVDSTTNTLTLGELKKPWAGAGGGGGGDASFTSGAPFPPPWNPSGDEKGSGGGGGGGSVRILAIGDIVFGVAGQINARGGNGGGGENTNFFNRVGGGSGGGSGGHLIMETAGKIDMSAVVPVATAPNLWLTGGQGGAGAGDLGGASLGGGGASVETPAYGDACPTGYPSNNGAPCSVAAPNCCLGLRIAAGGDGGPGIIQLHVNNNQPGGDLLLPVGVTLADICKPSPLCDLGTCRFVPSFGRRSQAQSLWVPMGLGGFDSATSTFKPVTFSFGGTDPLTGQVLTAGGLVVMLPALLPAAPVDPNAVTPPFVVPGNPFQMVMDASALVGGPDEYLLESPVLLRGYLIEETSGPIVKRFTIADASFSTATNQLTLTVSPSNGNLNSVGGSVSAALIPAFFRVETLGIFDSLPPSATIQIQFEATSADVNGDPDLTLIQGPVTDINLLNTPTNGLLRFLRFGATFDIDALGQGLSPNNPRPELDYLKVPFRY